MQNIICRRTKAAACTADVDDACITSQLLLFNWNIEIYGIYSIRITAFFTRNGMDFNDKTQNWTINLQNFIYIKRLNWFCCFVSIRILLRGDGAICFRQVYELDKTTIWHNRRSEWQTAISKQCWIVEFILFYLFSCDEWYFGALVT